MRQESTLSKTTHNIINEEEEWFQFWETQDDFVYNKTTTNRNNKKKQTEQRKHIEGQVTDKEVPTNRDQYALPCLEAAEQQCESLLDQSKIDRRLSSARMSATSVN